jgi:undecaprenyl-diphosphatase
VAESMNILITLNQWISFHEPFTFLFDIIIQLGAILAVVVFFWKRLWPFSQDAAHTKQIWATWFKTLVAVVPSFVLGALLKKTVETHLFNPLTVAIALIVGGGALILIEKTSRREHISSLAHLSYSTAAYIGLIQCLALIPGTSRSAVTIIGAMLLGVSRLAAAEFSFFLAIPTMVAASGYSLLKHGLSFSSSEVILLVTGFVVSFVVALGVIKFLMKYIQQHTFAGFGWYRVVLGVVVIITLLLT